MRASLSWFKSKILWLVVGVVALAGSVTYFGKQPAQPVVETGITYFAKVVNGEVVDVIVADQAFIDSGAVGDPKMWVPNPTDGTKRDGYASKGDKYEKTKSKFSRPDPKIKEDLEKLNAVGTTTPQ